MQSFFEFQSQIDLLNNEIRRRFDDLTNERFTITDGALNPGDYYNLFMQTSLPRIMWLMKEPYDEEGGIGGGWDFHSAFFKGESSYTERLVRGSSRPTWQPVVYVSYSIMNGFLLYNEMDYISQNPEMADALHNIAWVNVSKLPALGVTRSDSNQIKEFYHASKDLLSKQINLLDPNIIICGGTFHCIQSQFPSVELKQFKSVNYISVGKITYIGAYHPAQTVISREVYCDDIIVLCKSIWNSTCP